jgi:hypothetical protein
MLNQVAIEDREIVDDPDMGDTVACGHALDVRVEYGAGEQL